MDPFLASFMTQAGVAAVNAVTRGGPRRQYKWNKRAAADSNAMNRSNAEWAIEQNKRLQEEQRMYDSPQAQMARYKAAGLNPHLIYGSGSSAGSAFPISTQGIAPTRIDAPDASYGNLGSDYLQAGQMLANTGLAEQRIEESRTKQALTSIMTDIAKTNPMLNPDVAEWVHTSTMEVAKLKAIESRQWMAKDEQGVMRISEKINNDVELMAQKIGLNNADLQIRNKILESKEFENAIKEIQMKWLKDAEITPQHIYQGIMLVMQKMLGR